MGIKFNDDMVDRYKANFRVNADKQTVTVHRLNLKIIGKEIEKTEIFKLKMPTHYIG